MILCVLLGHKWTARIYPPGVDRCARCGKRRHGLVDRGRALR